jgi:hypothetical protein
LFRFATKISLKQQSLPIPYAEIDTRSLIIGVYRYSVYGEEKVIETEKITIKK